MKTKTLVKEWFKKWEEGNFYELPISENFRHNSPYGTIESKKEYISLIEANKGKFLGHNFIIHEEIYDKDRACVRYTAQKEKFSLDVSEWYHVVDCQID